MCSHQIGELDGGMGDLFRLVDLSKAVYPGVGNRDDTVMSLTRYANKRDVRTRQGGHERTLPRLGQADNSNLSHEFPQWIMEFPC